MSWSRPKALLLRVTLVVASTVFTLGVSELGLRLFFPIPFSIERSMYFEPDPETGYRMKPYSQGSFSGQLAFTNRHGHRSDDIPLAKAVDVFRILVLGDSFTVGAGVGQHESYPSVLLQLLTRESSRRYEVANAGVGGWGPFQYAQYYENYGFEFEPDMILIGFFVGNDAFETTDSTDKLASAVMGRRVTREAVARATVPLRVLLYEHSHLARLATKTPLDDRSFARSDCQDFSPEFLQIQRGRAATNHRKASPDLLRRVQAPLKQVSRISRLADEAGIPLFVVLIPDENQLNPALQDLVFDNPIDYDLDMPQKTLAPLFSRAGVDVLDLLPAFRADERCLYANNTHWTAAGHRLAAEQILEAIRGYLP